MKNRCKCWQNVKFGPIKPKIMFSMSSRIIENAGDNGIIIDTNRGFKNFFSEIQILSDEENNCWFLDLF